MLELVPPEDEIRFIYAKRDFRKSLCHMIKNIDIIKIKKELRSLDRKYRLKKRRYN